jgi:hypothetical protein
LSRSWNLSWRFHHIAASAASIPASTVATTTIAVAAATAAAIYTLFRSLLRLVLGLLLPNTLRLLESSQGSLIAALVVSTACVKHFCKLRS